MPTRKEIILGDAGLRRLDRLYLLSLASYSCYKSSTPVFAASLGEYVGYTEGGFVLTPGNAIPNFIVGHDSNTAVFAFCGTNAMNQIVDSIIFSGTEVPDSMALCRTHTFFQWCADSLWPYVRSVLDSLSSGKKVVFTGHSLGGACALLIAARAKLYYSGFYSCVTFGAPRVGDANFTTNYASKLDDLTQVRNHLDGIPDLPPTYYLQWPGTAPPDTYVSAVASFEDHSDPWVLMDDPLVIRHRARNAWGANIFAHGSIALMDGVRSTVGTDTRYTDRHSMTRYCSKLYSLSRTLFTLPEAEFLGALRASLDGANWAWIVDGPPPEQPAIPDRRLFVPAATPPPPLPAPQPPPPVTPEPVRVTTVQTIFAAPTLPATGIASGPGSSFTPGYMSEEDWLYSLGYWPRANYLFKGNDRRLLRQLQSLINAMYRRDDAARFAERTQKISTRALMIDDDEPLHVQTVAAILDHVTTLLGLIKE